VQVIPKSRSGNWGRYRRPPLSVVVVSFNMRRELPRTLHSLSARYQVGIGRGEYEIILVDNGSEPSWGTDDLNHIEADLKIINLGRNARPSPASAINIGLEHAGGQLVGVMIDGARLVTPGLLHTSTLAARLHPRPLIATVAFHLGHESQSLAIQNGYTAAVEDQLLDSINWPHDGYKLFDIATLADSSRDGWFGPTGESSLFFLPREMWEEMGGFCERFESPGGGLVNHDAYSRAVALPGIRLFRLLGEGTFHQVHGGIATNSPPGTHWEKWRDEYRRIRGRDFSRPSVTPMLFGALPPAALRHLQITRA